jgi:hypothetical protein
MIGLSIGIGIVQQVIVGILAALLGLFSTDRIAWAAFFAAGTGPTLFRADTSRPARPAKRWNAPSRLSRPTVS